MSSPNINYEELTKKYKAYQDIISQFFRLKTTKEEELQAIYQNFKTNFLNPKIYTAINMYYLINNAFPYNNRYLRSYLRIMKMVYEDFKINPEPYVSSVLFYFFNEEYGLPVSLFNQKLFKSYQEKNYTIDIHQENTIYRAIMDDDKETLIMFTQRDDFDKDIKLYSDLYPNDGYSLLEICCYHRSVNCFKYLITEYGSKITPKCLQLSFLSGNPDILNECLKNQNPDQACMTNAIVAQNIDFVQFLVNEYGLEIKL